MSYFNTTIESDVIQGPGGIFFVTSDRYDQNEPKVYKVREFKPETGRILTHEHESLAPSHELRHAQGHVPSAAPPP